MEREALIIYKQVRQGISLPHSLHFNLLLSLFQVVIADTFQDSAILDINQAYQL